MTIGWVQAVVEAIGEADNEIGGFWITRLTAGVALGAASLPVEMTDGWGDTGKVSIDGVLYSYTGKTATTLTGITYLENGVDVVGAKQAHRQQSDIIDVSQSRSAIDLVRRAMLVDYAEGADLSTVGRNVGVLRLPFIGSDERFRKIIKALAYNPRGTMHGLELALDGLVDPGNYEIFEDLINFPCVVFIRLKGAATTEDKSQGKTFVGFQEPRPAPTTTTTSTNRTPKAIQGVRWKDEAIDTDCRTAKPSVPTVVEYVGQTPAAIWTFDGGTASETSVTVLASGAIAMVDTGGFTSLCLYKRLVRVRPESKAVFGWINSPTTGGTISNVATSGNQWVLRLNDMERAIAVGIIGIDASNYAVGFIDTGTGQFIAGGTTYAKDVFRDVSLVKDGRNAVKLYVDGMLIQTLAHVSFAADTDHTALFGCGSLGLSGMNGRVKQVYLNIATATDYWNARGTTASVAVLSGRAVDTNGVLTTVSTDIGRRFVVSGGTVLNARGGTNNGTFEVISHSGDTVNLQGPLLDGIVSLNAANPKRITVALPGVFKYPQDLGKVFQIAGSGAGNNGDYEIQKILDPNSLVDFGTLLTGGQTQEISNVCEVVTATFATEAGLDGRLHPSFVDEANVSWELSAAGTLAGSALTLRQALPITTGGYTRVMNIVYSDVLSAQLLFNQNVQNAIIDPGPPVKFEFYPAYISDPLGYVRDYIDDLTAAGVIADYRIIT